MSTPMRIPEGKIVLTYEDYCPFAQRSQPV